MWKRLSGRRRPQSSRRRAVLEAPVPLEPRIVPVSAVTSVSLTPSVSARKVFVPAATTVRTAAAASAGTYTAGPADWVSIPAGAPAAGNVPILYQNANGGYNLGTFPVWFRSSVKFTAGGVPTSGLGSLNTGPQGVAPDISSAYSRALWSSSTIGWPIAPLGTTIFTTVLTARVTATEATPLAGPANGVAVANDPWIFTPSDDMDLTVEVTLSDLEMQADIAYRDTPTGPQVCMKGHTTVNTSTQFGTGAGPDDPSGVVLASGSYNADLDGGGTFSSPAPTDLIDQTFHLLAGQSYWLTADATAYGLVGPVPVGTQAPPPPPPGDAPAAAAVGATAPTTPEPGGSLAPPLGQPLRPALVAWAWTEATPTPSGTGRTPAAGRQTPRPVGAVHQPQPQLVPDARHGGLARAARRARRAAVDLGQGSLWDGAFVPGRTAGQDPGPGIA
jgi:hypothetical protein